MPTKTAAAKTKPQPEMELPPKVPVISPSNVEINTEGFVWRTILVRCPSNLVADDLRYPTLWRNVQSDRLKALRKMDRLMILSHDESWYAEAVVAYASSAECKLLIQRRSSFRDADQQLYSDGEFKVHWNGNCYVVVRCSDNIQVVPDGYQTESAAIGALHQHRPKVVGA